MPKVLHIVSSPREERSVSVQVAAAYMRAFRERYPDAQVDTLDVWEEELPPFNNDALNAKYAGLSGTPLTDRQQLAWQRIQEIAERFHVADVLVIGVPMWNFGIPYRLKHLIDLVSQKDVLFRFSEKGFEGMLKDKRAIVICARGISYATGTGTPEAEFDFQKSYMEMWLRFVGVADIETITVERTLLGPEVDQEERRKGIAQAETLARAHR